MATIEGTCGEEKDVIVTFKYDKRSEAVKRILNNAKLKNSLAGIIYEMVFQNQSFRLYSSGKVIFRSIESREKLYKLLIGLLS